MATKLYSTSVGGGEFAIIEATGSATVSGNIELTVDLATTLVNTTGAGTRAIKREEVLEALERFKAHILKSPNLLG